MRRARRGPPGRSGARTSVSGSGERSARTTARTATRGTTSITTSPDPGPTGGARTALAGSPMTSSVSALPSPSGTKRHPILKERAFGLTNSEGNHGEDVKDYYFYLDSTPTHLYMKYLYKYPQREFPYRDLVETNRGWTREELEYLELLDTGDFRGRPVLRRLPRYAKAGPDDILIRVSVHNRGKEPALAVAAASDAVVPEHVVVGRRGREAGPLREGRGDRGPPSRVGRLHPLMRRFPGTPVHGERAERPEAVGPAKPDAVRKGCVPPVRHLRGL